MERPFTEWESDRTFIDAAKLLYPRDLELATAYQRERGRVRARDRMQHRYEGWRLLVSLATIAETADRCRQQLAQQSKPR
jgi:hypothetical protein